MALSASSAWLLAGVLTVLYLVLSAVRTVDSVRAELLSALDGGHPVTIGVVGPGGTGFYRDTEAFARAHPGRVSLTVKRGHIPPREIARLSRLHPLWISAKYPTDRWSEFGLFTEVRRLGGDAGLTVACYSSDAGDIVRRVLALGGRVRLVKGFYRGELSNARATAQYRRLAKTLAADPGGGHLLATHDADMIAAAPGLRVAHYLRARQAMEGLAGEPADLYVPIGRTGLAALTEFPWIANPFVTI